MEPLREAENPDERLAMARRLVADRCLYGVDKNPLAVEMAKLSLWLITLDKGRPFTFLNHALKPGDSVVGVDLDQLAHWNLDTSGTPELFAEGIRHDIEKIIALRREIAGTPVIDTRDQARKAYLLAQAEAIAHDLRRGCDLLVASYYNELPAAERERLRVALLHAFRDGADVPPDLADAANLGALHPFYWQLEFPEVFLEDGRGGFDAFVGNPPFIGGKRIRDTLGDDYRQILYDLYPGSSGNADYCVFFFLRGYEHLRPGSTLGLIATNTIAQGDTRQAGLDKIGEQGGIIYNASINRAWPGQAAVVVNVIHIAKGKMSPPFMLDGTPVQYISTLLDTRKVTGDPYRLAQNEGKSHIGSYVHGLGFTMSLGEAQELISRDPKNANVLFPYIIGQDLNSTVDQSSSRWIINFFDWPLRRNAEGSWVAADEKQQKKWLRNGIVPDDYPGPVAYDYPDCMAIVSSRVYPERRKKKGRYARVWWQYGRRQEKLYEAIAPLKRVLIIAQTSKTLAFAFVPKGMVYSHMTVVIASDEDWWFALLQSSHHIAWVLEYASSLKGDARYIPTDCFETFPFPLPTPEQQAALDRTGEIYHEHRRQAMLARQEGLTATYNRFHDPDETSEDIARLRELHVEMDHAVAAAYGWDDLDLGHGFHETPQGVRYTISEAARREVLGRLLELNHQQYAEEVKAGLHGKKGKGRKRGKETEGQPALF